MWQGKLSPEIIRILSAGEEVILGYQNFEEEHAKLIASFILSPPSSALPITQLALYGNFEVRDEGIISLCSAFSSSSHCSRLSTLNLRFCGIGEAGAIALRDYIASSRCSLTCLVIEDNEKVGDRGIASICTGLYQNSSLTSLYISGCGIGNIGGEHILTTLRKYNSTLLSIDLGSNKISGNIQQQIKKVLRNSEERKNGMIGIEVQKMMEDLEITEKQLPPIYQSKSVSDQLAYLQQLQRGKQSTQKIKLMVVGEEGVGKTTLIQHILSTHKQTWMGDTFDGGARIGITDGIDIHVFQPNPEKELTINVYDFAGQEIYYSTHRFVLSSEAIYLLLFDASKSIRANRLAHWIHTLNAVAPSATVFLVATHFDDASSITLLPENLESLYSLLDNIAFLTREDNALQFICPSQYPSFQIHPQVIDTMKSLKKTLPIWPISLGLQSKKSSVENNRVVIFQLIDAVISKIDQIVTSTIVPSSWLRYRSYLFPSTSNNNILDKFSNDTKGISFNINSENNESNKISIGGEDKDKDLLDVKLKELLYDKPGFKLGIMREKDIAQFGNAILQFKENETKSFIELLESWGEIVHIRNIRYPDQSFIVLEPRFLISLFKDIVSAKKFISNQVNSKRYKLKAKINTTLTKSSSPNYSPHLIDANSLLQLCVEKLLDNHFDDSNNFNNDNNKNYGDDMKGRKKRFSLDEAQHLISKELIPLLMELQLIYPLSNLSPQLYLVPSMLKRKSPSKKLHFLFNPKTHPIFSSSLLKKKVTKKSSELPSIEDDTIAIIIREYQFVYLPSGAFSQLMIEVWKHFGLIPIYSQHLEDEKMFWENGFIISDTSPHQILSSSCNFYSNEVCLIELTSSLSPSSSASSSSNKNKNKDEISQRNGNCIRISLTCPSSKLSNILPFLHRTIVSSIIHTFEFERQKYKPVILCSATSHSSSGLEILTKYEYNNCFQSITTAEGDDHYTSKSPPANLLPFLIPEYFAATNVTSSSSLASTYFEDVREVRKLGEGMGGEVWYGYWHSHEVAIKKPRAEEIPAILNEIHLLRTLHHPAILRLLDVYSDPTLTLVTEFCRAGDLQHLLIQEDPLHPILLCCIVRDISDALSYLHNHSPPVIHCDVREPNIFIKSLNFQKVGSVCAVLGDVGFSRVADPVTRRAGVNYPSDDIRSVMNIISIFIHTLQQTYLPGNDASDRKGDEENESSTVQQLLLLVRSVIKKFESILSDAERLDFIIDSSTISQSLVSDLITPYLIKNNNNQMDDIQRQHDYQYSLSKRLTSPSFSNYKRLVELSNSSSSSALDQLEELLSLLSSEHHNNNGSSHKDGRIEYDNDYDDDDERENNYYWKALCRYVIPVLGRAIDQHQITIAHLTTLESMSIQFYHHPLGDYKEGFGLLHYACASANLPILEYILNNSGSCHTIPKPINDLTYLYSRSAAIHLLVNSLQHPLIIKNKNNNAESGEGCLKTTRMMDLLIQHGADINLQDGKGETALIKAAMEGNQKLLVHILNYRGVDVHVLSNEGISAIVAAARFNSIGHSLCIKALLQLGSERSPALTIVKSELERIREVASTLMKDSLATYARFSHCTISIQSWLLEV